MATVATTAPRSFKTAHLIVVDFDQSFSEPRLHGYVATNHEMDEDDSDPKPVQDSEGLNWDDETQRLIDWFKTTTPPAEPFELCQGVTILDPVRWWRSIEGDIAAGPSGPRATYGAVQGDLRKLHDRMNAEDAEYDRLERDAIQNEADFDNARLPGHDGGATGDPQP